LAPVGGRIFFRTFLGMKGVLRNLLFPRKVCSSSSFGSATNRLSSISPFLLQTQRQLSGRRQLSDEKSAIESSGLYKRAREFQNRNETWRSIPNLLTLGRIAGTPVIAWLILKGDYSSACWGLGLAGFTDWLDGYLAKRWQQQSVLGSYLDPLADKLLIGSLVLALGFKHILQPWLVGLILFRDVVLVACSLYMRSRLLTPPITLSRFFNSKIAAVSVTPSWLSKMNTGGQLALIGLSLLSAASHWFPLSALFSFSGLIGATTFLSGVDYLIKFYTANLTLPQNQGQGQSRQPPSSNK